MAGEMTQLDLVPVVHREIDGIEMGVLPDGTPYLTARGLAKLCGKAPSSIIALSSNWQDERFKPRGKIIARALADHGYTEQELYIPIQQGGTKGHAHPDSVCMALLEYYAFEADGDRKHALSVYRILARQSLRQFIYGRVGYDPKSVVPDQWKKFHDRLLLNNTFPQGFFSVFREMADIIVSLIQNGMTVDEHVVPDISVGKLWSARWVDQGLDRSHGDRKKHVHVYPDYFPQKGEVEAWVYPLGALGEFRIWMQSVYLPSKFPDYLKRKAKQGALPPSHVEVLLAALLGPALAALPEPEPEPA